MNVKVCATHGGISVGEDGASHQALEDLAIMRSLPNMVVMCPSDDVEARLALKAAAEHVGPVYMRFGRAAVPVVHDENMTFEIGKGEVLREGKDVSLIANGLCVAPALEAANKLSEEGIDVEVINICTIKPLDEELVLASAKKTGKVVTAEEAWVTGGLGGAVCELLSEKCPTPVLRLGMPDRFGESGPAGELLEKYGFTAEAFAEKIRTFVK